MAPDWSIYDSDIKELYVKKNNTARSTLETINQKYGTNITIRQFKAKYSRLKNWQAEEWMAVIYAIRNGMTQGRKYEVYRLNQVQPIHRVNRALQLYEKKIGDRVFPHIDLGINTVDKHHIEIRTLALDTATPPSQRATDSGNPTNISEIQTGHNYDRHEKSGFDMFPLEVCSEEMVYADLSTPGPESFPNFLCGDMQIDQGGPAAPFSTAQSQVLHSSISNSNCYDFLSSNIQQDQTNQLTLPRSNSDNFPSPTILFNYGFKTPRPTYGSFWDMPEVLRLFPTLRDNRNPTTNSAFSLSLEMISNGSLSSYFVNSDPQLTVLNETLLQTEAIISMFQGSPPPHYENKGPESLYKMLCIVLYLTLNNEFKVSNAKSLLLWTIENGFVMELVTFLRQTSSHSLQLAAYLSQALLSARREHKLSQRDLEACSEIINMTDSRSLSSASGFHMLCDAMYLNDIRVAKLLVSKGLDVEFQPPFISSSGTLIVGAIEKGSIDMFELLLGSKANISPANLSTALVSAVQGRHIEKAKLLLQKMAKFDPSLRIKGVPISKLAKTNSPQVDKILLGMPVRNEVAKPHFLIEAAEKGNRMLAQKLVELEILSNESLERALRYAIEEGNHGAVRTLLSRGVDPRMQRYRTQKATLSGDGREDFDPLLAAAKCRGSKRLNIFYLLQKYGVKIDVETLRNIRKGDHDFVGNVFCDLADAGFEIRVVGPSAIEEQLIKNRSDAFFRCATWLDQGSPINKYGVGGLNALQAAAKSGDLALTVDCIERGADVNLPASDDGGMTALQAAAYSRNLDVVNCLLDAGAVCQAPPAKYRGYTALEAATHDIRFLPHIRDPERTVLGILKTLLCHRAPVNRSDGTASHLLSNVIFKRWTSCLELLLRAGARPQGTSEHSAYSGRMIAMTPLQFAAYVLDLGAMQMLLDHGADIHAPAQPGTGLTALQAVVSIRGEDAKVRIREVVEWLVVRGVDVNAPAAKEDGRTALQAATSMDRPDLTLVKLLLDHGADVNAPAAEEGGRTALQAAAATYRPNLMLVELLLDHGADVNAPAARVRGITALQATAIRGNLRIAKILLDQGANVNAPAAIEEGRTAIEGAAEQGRMEMVKILLNHGADSSNGFETAIELASQNGHWHIVDFLKKHLQEWGASTGLG